MNTFIISSRSLLLRFLAALVAIIGFFSPFAALAQIQVWIPPVTTNVWHEATTESVWEPPVMGTCPVPEVGHWEPRQVTNIVHHPATTTMVHHPATTTVVHHPATTTIVHHPATTQTVHHEEEVIIVHVERQTHIEHHPAETHTVYEEGYYNSYWVDYYADVCDVYCTWITEEGTENYYEYCWEENCREEWIGGGWVDEWVEGYEYTVTTDAWDEEVVDVEEHDEYHTIPAWDEEMPIPAWDETVEVPAWDQTVEVPAWDEPVQVPAWDEPVVTTVQVWVVDVPAHDEPCTITEGRWVNVEHPGWWETVLVAAGYWRDVTPQVEIVSRDKFLAGSFVMPQEVSDIEIEIASTTENMGRYGGLLGGGTTTVYASVPEILSDADINSGTTPREVWFVRDSVNSRKINFYTCFNAIDNVHIRLIRGNQQAVTQHQLYAAQDFADWISYVDGWVKGVGFEGSGPVGTGIPAGFAFGYTPGGGSGFTGGALHTLSRAPLIPIFNVIAQTQGMEAFALGMFEGVKAGLKDDKEMAQMIINGYLQTNDWLATQVANEIIDWQTNPLRRSREFMAMCVRICEDAIFAPLAAVNQAYSTWDKFKNGSWSVWDAIKNAAAKQYLVPLALAYNLAGGIVSWTEDFGNRMIAGAEKTAYQAAPWHTSELASDLIGFGRIMVYSGGYYLGYLGEQVAMGIATGGVVKIGTVVIKGGAILSTQLVKKTAFAVATRSAVFKKSLSSLVISAELKRLIDSGLTKAMKIPISGGSKISVVEFVEMAIGRPGFNRAQFNLQTVVERVAVPNSNLQKLVKTPNGDAQVWVSLGEHYNMLGDTTTANSSRGWIEFHERTLTASGPVIVEDRATQMLTVWAGDTTAATRAATSTALDGVALRAMQKPNSPWVVGTYREMKAITRGEGNALEAHHIVEKRHLENWGIDQDTAPAVILAGPHHWTVTTDLLQRMPTGRSYTKA